MEKKLGVVFTTIVTHINNTTILSFFSNPSTNIQTTLKHLFLSLPTIHTILCIHIFTDPLSISVINYNNFWLWVSSFSFLRSSVSRSYYCSRRDIGAGHNLHTLTLLNI